jgi:two-component system NarL family response regulator
MKGASLLRILLIEDDEMFRLGLSIKLQQQSYFQVVAEAEDGETAIELAKQYPLDIVLLDVGLPGIGGVQTCRLLKQEHPDLPILVLTSRSEQSLIERLIEAKAQGYCLKGIDAEALSLAIRSVAAGASWWDKVATAEIQAAFTDNSGGDDAIKSKEVENPLTKREQEILALVANGRSNQEIAKLLYISLGTVKVHVHTILQKLEVRDRTQAAVLAMQKGLVAQELLRNSDR